MRFLVRLLVLTLAARLLLAHPTMPTIAGNSHVSRTKSCPSGFIVEGKFCSKSEFVAPQYVCPPGSVLYDGQCASFQRAVKKCAASFSLTGEYCSMAQQVPAEFACASGQLDASGRGCHVTQEVLATCPTGFIKEILGDGVEKCVRSLMATKRCPSGSFSVDGLECVKSSTVAADPQCPASFGLSSDGKSCTKRVPVAPYCPTGFFVENSNECIKEVESVAAPCPNGFTPVDQKSCVRPFQQPARSMCETGFELSSSVCVQLVPLPPLCPEFSTRDVSTGRCESIVAEEPFCENGYELVEEAGNSSSNSGSAMCRLKDIFPVPVKCMSGFTLFNDRCKRATSVEPAKKCSNGVLESDFCVTQETTTPSVECPSGFRLIKGASCVKDVAYDCSTRVKQTVCEMPAFVAQILDQPTDSNKLRRLSHKIDYKTKSDTTGDHQPSTTTTAEKTPACREVSRVIPRMCSKVERAPLQHVCPEDSVSQGKLCLAKKYHEPQVFCSTGQLDARSNRCVIFTVVDPERSCPAGSQKRGASCEREIDTRPAAMACPAGSEQSYNDQSGLTKCVTVKQEIQRAPRVVQKTPQLVCQFGVLRNNVCVDEEVVPRDRQCPEGAENRNDKCVKTTALITPPHHQFETRPRYVCADGKPAERQNCLVRQVTGFEYLCQSGGSLVGDRCLQITDLVHRPPQIIRSAAIPRCADGLTLQGDTCVAVTRELPQRTCADGFAFYQEGPRECVRTYPQQALCPTGSVSTGTGCAKKVVVPVQITEIREYTKGL